MRYLAALLALGLLITLHELGHLLAARLFGMRATRFSIGFGPPVLTVMRRGFQWRLGAFPLGGWALIEGLNPHAPQGSKSHPPWQRGAVLLAGSFVNALLALGLLVWLFASGTHVPVPRTLGLVEPGSPAARAQLRPGDVIVSIDGRPLTEWRELVEAVLDSPGRPLSLEIERDGERHVQPVTPRDDGHGGGRLGISQQYVYREHTTGEAFGLAAAYLGRLVREGVALSWRVFAGRPGADLTAPGLLARQAEDPTSLGWDEVWRMVVHLSFALSLFYLLPWPGLDGGKLLVLTVESLTGRTVPARLLTLANLTGFLLLVAFVVWVAFRDVRIEWPSRAPAPQPTTEAPAEPPSAP